MFSRDNMSCKLAVPHGVLWTRLAVFSLLSLLLVGNVPVVEAQFPDSQFGNVYVHVVYPNQRSAGSRLRVQLMSGSGSTPVAESFTDDRGQVQFLRVFVGEYHIIVNGDGIQEADSGAFEVDRRRSSQDIFITVHPSNEKAENQPTAISSSVAALDLKIPQNAHKEFDKGMQAISDQDWNKALQRLNRAIEFYPDYALAYNNLALVYGHLNDVAHEREELEKAIALNDHLVPALVNLAKLDLRESDAPRAETLLEGAVRAGPTNVEALTLLGQAQLLNKHYQQAIASAQSVHAVPHQNFAVVHYIAARAYEGENRLSEAVAELQLFLKEEPSGARADHVRAEILKLQQNRP
jgi:tetratricopeptide (TPR) repeat protein